MTSPFGRLSDATTLIGIASTRESGVVVVDDDGAGRRSCYCEKGRMVSGIQRMGTHSGGVCLYGVGMYAGG